MEDRPYEPNSFFREEKEVELKVGGRYSGIIDDEDRDKDNNPIIRIKNYPPIVVVGCPQKIKNREIKYEIIRIANRIIYAEYIEKL